MALADETSERIAKGTPPLSKESTEALHKEISGWMLKDSVLERELKFEGFRQAVEFVNRVADIAEREDHHPDICISYNKVDIALSTHSIGGLSRNDFIVAAKIDRLAGD